MVQGSVRGSGRTRNHMLWFSSSAFLRQNSGTAGSSRSEKILKNTEGRDVSFHLCTWLAVGEGDPLSTTRAVWGYVRIAPRRRQAPGLGWPFTCALPQPGVQGFCFTCQHCTPVWATLGEPVSRQEIHVEGEGGSHPVLTGDGEIPKLSRRKGFVWLLKAFVMCGADLLNKVSSEF